MGSTRKHDSDAGARSAKQFLQNSIVCTVLLSINQHKKPTTTNSVNFATVRNNNNNNNNEHDPIEARGVLPIGALFFPFLVSAEKQDDNYGHELPYKFKPGEKGKRYSLLGEKSVGSGANTARSVVS